MLCGPLVYSLLVESSNTVLELNCGLYVGFHPTFLGITPKVCVCVCVRERERGGKIPVVPWPIHIEILL